MEDREKRTSRSYRVILKDRTTSPKVNRYIRDLTGKSVWEASSVMNTVPSVILENIPLHKAIEIKSALGKFGLNIAIENVEDLSEKKGEPRKEKEQREKAVSKPAESPPPKAEIPAKDDSSVNRISKLTPESPARLIRRRWKRTPVLWMVFPFIFLLIIVIIIYYIGEKGTLEKLLPAPKNNIVMSQESGEKLPQKRFIRSQDDILAKLKESQESMSSPSPISPNKEDVESDNDSVISNQSNYPDYSDKDNRSLDKPESSRTGLESDAGSIAGQRAHASKSKGEVSAAGTAGKADASRVPPGQSSSSAGRGMGDSPGPSLCSDLEFIGPKESLGISPEKLNAIIDHARNAVKSNNEKAASEDFQRLKLAEDYKNDLSEPVARMMNSPELQALKDDLQDIYERYLLDDDLKFYPELTGVIIKIHTNLPDASKVLVQLNLPGSKKALEYPTQVEEGIIELPHSGGFPSGLIAVRIILVPLTQQPNDVINVIGIDGENLSGGLNDGKGNIEYNGYLNNRIARSRGDIRKEDAVDELYQLAVMNGMENFELDDFEDYLHNDKMFITISANADDEEDFLMRACRSTGMMTAEMDNPPPYLRLVLNGGQYFIPTFKCRILLREYRENDPEAVSYLINSLLTF